MRLASLDFLLFFFPAVVLVGICLPKSWRNAWCGVAGFIYCFLQGLPAFLPMAFSVFVVRLLLLRINETSSERRKKITMIAGFCVLFCMVLLSRFWYGAVPIATALCLMQLVEQLLMYRYQPQPMLPFGVYFGYCFGLMRLWAGPILTVAQYEYITENCKCSLMRFGKGIGSFIRGFAKLVLLALPANTIAELLLQLAEAKSLSLLDAFIGLVVIFFAVHYGLSGMAQMGRTRFPYVYAISPPWYTDAYLWCNSGIAVRSRMEWFAVEFIPCTDSLGRIKIATFFCAHRDPFSSCRATNGCSLFDVAEHRHIVFCNFCWCSGLRFCADWCKWIPIARRSALYSEDQLVCVIGQHNAAFADTKVVETRSGT